ncbi:MAG: SIR2 family protein [Acidobacteria bacterium]|nr:SIR2 family protein [Acidobacteriota bacterium]
MVSGEETGELIRMLQEGKLAVFVGAGCSAPTIPTGEQLTAQLKRDLFKQIHRLVTRAEPSGEKVEGWWKRYRQSCSRKLSDYSLAMLRTFPHPTERRAFFESLMDGAWPTEAQFLLAQLVGEGLIREVYTTNFDRFIEVATALLAPEDPPLVVTHDASLEVGTKPRTVVIKLHGDFHETDLANLPAEIRAKYTKNMRGKLSRLLSERALLVVGYGGDNSVLRILSDTIVRGGCQHGLYWAQRRGSPVRPGVRRLLSLAAKRGIIARQLVIEDAKALFAQLHEALHLRRLPLPEDLFHSEVSAHPSQEFLNWLVSFCSRYRTRGPAPRFGFDAARQFDRELVPTVLSKQIGERLASGKQLIFVWGPAGVGKSCAIAKALAGENLAEHALWFRPFQIGTVPGFQMRSDITRFLRSQGVRTERNIDENSKLLGVNKCGLVFVDVARHNGTAEVRREFWEYALGYVILYCLDAGAVVLMTSEIDPDLLLPRLAADGVELARELQRRLHHFGAIVHAQQSDPVLLASITGRSPEMVADAASTNALIAKCEAATPAHHSPRIVKPANSPATVIGPNRHLRQLVERWKAMLPREAYELLVGLSLLRRPEDEVGLEVLLGGRTVAGGLPVALSLRLVERSGRNGEYFFLHHRLRSMLQAVASADCESTRRLLPRRLLMLSQRRHDYRNVLDAEDLLFQSGRYTLAYGCLHLLWDGLVNDPYGRRFLASTIVDFLQTPILPHLTAEHKMQAFGDVALLATIELQQSKEGQIDVQLNSALIRALASIFFGMRGKPTGLALANLAYAANDLTTAISLLVTALNKASGRRMDRKTARSRALMYARLGAMYRAVRDQVSPSEPIRRKDMAAAFRKGMEDPSASIKFSKPRSEASNRMQVLLDLTRRIVACCREAENQSQIAGDSDFAALMSDNLLSYAIECGEFKTAQNICESIKKRMYTCGPAERGRFYRNLFLLALERGQWQRAVVYFCLAYDAFSADTYLFGLSVTYQVLLAFLKKFPPELIDASFAAMLRQRVEEYASESPRPGPPPQFDKAAGC